MKRPRPPHHNPKQAWHDIAFQIETCGQPVKPLLQALYLGLQLVRWEIAQLRDEVRGLRTDLNALSEREADKNNGWD